MSHLTPFMKAKIVVLFEDNKSISEIARLLNISRKAVSLWVKRYGETGTVEKKRPGFAAGAYTSQNPRHNEIVARHAAEPFLPTSSTATAYGITTQTVRNHLHAAKIGCFRPAKKIALSDAHRRERVHFAEQYLNFDFINNIVIFTDEKSFKSDKDGRKILWRKRGERYNEMCVLPTRTSGRITLAYWGWMSSMGPGELVEVGGRFNSEKYLEILRDVMIPTVRVAYPGGQIYLIQDNCSVHCSRVVQQWLGAQNDITVIRWPSKSPDLNVIENLWGQIILNWDSSDVRNEDIPIRGQIENSPLYVQKEFEIENCDEWEVSRCRVHLGALIGSGAFGRVHVATLDMLGGETLTVAAKMLSEDANEEECQDFLREIVMLKHVGVHKHVIKLIGCCTQRSPLMALLEHAPRGDLLSLLRAARGRRKVPQSSDVTRRADSGDRDTENGRPSEGESEYTNFSDSDPALSEGKLEEDCEKNRDHYVAEPALRLDGSMMREYALQVALGMQHLEERGITHRDLAARNILVDGAGTLKVADFGLSRSGIYVHTRARPVPLRWLAPEAILHSQYCSASDVWAFAVLLWEIATLGGFPYAELSNHQVPPFLAGGGRLPKPARASPRLYQLMVECWSETPESRPSFKDIVDKLQVQQLLYVDLTVLPTDDVFNDLDFDTFETN